MTIWACLDWWLRIVGLVHTLLYLPLLWCAVTGIVEEWYWFFVDGAKVEK